ncbi:MAG: aminodeoxychorismate synthase component I [Phycisphaerales bacterium]|nr:MAG: aminodeoxychorismate synthase component I [Phycisphaerales bacterium]
MSFSKTTAPAILESSLSTTPYSRFTILTCDPVDEFVYGRWNSVCPFRSLDARVATYPTAVNPDAALPFVGGWIGFLTYEVGLHIERIECTTRGERGLPLVCFRLYDFAAIHDHAEGRWYALAVDWPAEIARRRPPVSARLASVRTILEQASALSSEAAPPGWTCSTPEPNMSRRAYSAKIEKAKRYIEAGDIYQVNLTQRWTATTDATPLELYRRLRRISPSSHAALLPWGEFAVISSSPELFLELRGRHVVTRPIKGTRPRGDDPRSDNANREELAQSEKERAELTMIVDLLRNDLGRVCSFGSVRVTEPGMIEQHPNVFHRVATIEGDLEPGRTWLELLWASFPGGSITGAPKIRAMQIIDELEPTQRGVYCGSIGIIGLDGSLSLNIAIRTMFQLGDRVHVYAGGAIVADSTADQEYDETIAKAAGMMRTLGCVSLDAAADREEVVVT